MRFMYAEVGITQENGSDHAICYQVYITFKIYVLYPQVGTTEKNGFFLAICNHVLLCITVKNGGDCVFYVQVGTTEQKKI